MRPLAAQLHSLEVVLNKGVVVVSTGLPTVHLKRYLMLMGPHGLTPDVFSFSLSE